MIRGEGLSQLSLGLYLLQLQMFSLYTEALTIHLLSSSLHIGATHDGETRPEIEDFRPALTGADGIAPIGIHLTMAL